MASRLGFVMFFATLVAACATASQTIGGFAAPAVTAPAVAGAPAATLDWPEPVEQVEVVDLELYDLNAMTSLSVAMPVDGNVDPDTANRLRRFFRCRRTHKSGLMAPGLLAKLADLGKRYPGRVIEIMSAYRARPYGARRSKHFIGHALDLRVRGVKLTALRDYLWSRYAGTGVGVGYYPGSGFVHMDHRPNQRDAAWTQRHKWARYQYHPWWSRRVIVAKRDTPLAR